MDEERERALSLAHDAEPHDGSATPEQVIFRARVYLDFLQGANQVEANTTPPDVIPPPQT